LNDYCWRVARRFSPAPRSRRPRPLPRMLLPRAFRTRIHPRPTRSAPGNCRTSAYRGRLPARPSSNSSRRRRRLRRLPELRRPVPRQRQPAVPLRTGQRRGKLPRKRVRLLRLQSLRRRRPRFRRKAQQRQCLSRHWPRPRRPVRHRQPCRLSPTIACRSCHGSSRRCSSLGLRHFFCGAAGPAKLWPGRSSISSLRPKRSRGLRLNRFPLPSLGYRRLLSSSGLPLLLRFLSNQHPISPAESYQAGSRRLPKNRLSRRREVSFPHA
jgi:hypothetical protein